MLVRTGLRACEWSTFPRRFSRLSRERRAARLAKLAASGRLRRDLALLLRTLSCIAYARDPGVQATLGVSSRCERANGAAPDPPPAPPLRPDALVPPDGVERCDVVVVGSGAGGAAAARALAERGLDVVVVEEGDYHDARDYDTDPLAALPMLYRDGGLTFAEGKPTIPVPVGRCVGGTTVINSGTCFRTPDAVLARWRDEFGIPWATELDAEFEALERDLRVAPVDPATAGGNAAVCREGAEALGASHGPILRNAGDVVLLRQLPDRLPDRRQAGGARGRAAPGGRGRRPGARGRASDTRARRGRAGRRRALPRRRARGAVRGPRPRRRAGGRGVRHAATAAPRGPGARLGVRRPAPTNPSGVLGRGAVRGSGAGLGRRDAELVRGRVAGPRAVSRSSRSPRCRSQPTGCRGWGRS